MALLLSLTANAWAAPGDEASRSAEAKKLCAAGQVAPGVAILAELFASTGDQDYVYNQGRCYQQNNHPDEAIARFREYLRRATGITKDERAEVETFIKELEGEREANARRGAAAAATASAPPRAVGAVAQPGFDRRSVGKASLVAGGALLVGGGLSWLIANGKYSSLKDDCNSHDCTLSRYNTGTRGVRTWDTVAGIALIGGAIGVLGGAGLYLWPPAHPGRDRSVEALVDPVSRSVSLKGRF